MSLMNGLRILNQFNIMGVIRNATARTQLKFCLETPYNNQHLAIYWCIFGVTDNLSTDIKSKKPTQKLS